MPNTTAVIAGSVGLALFNAGASVAVINAGMAITTFALTYGSTIASIGYSVYQASEAAKQQRGTSSDPNRIQMLVEQADSPQRLILGTATASGTVLFKAGKPPYIWYLIELASHEADGLVSVNINNTDIRIGADGFATQTPFLNGDNKYIEVSFRDGHIDQEIDPILARDFPDMPTTFRQRGKTTVCIKAHYGFGEDYEAINTNHGEVYGSGGFNPLFRVRGAKVFDPRDPAQLIDDPTTWKWSDNAALCEVHYLRHQWPDMRLLEDERINFDKLMVAADLCDRWDVTKSNEPFRRHTINAVIDSTEDPYDIINNMSVAMAGNLISDNQKFYPMPRARRKPVATFHEAMLVGGFEYQAEAEIGQSPNIIKTRFIAPDRAFKKVEGPVLRDAALIAVDGRPNEVVINGAYVERHERMQRLANRELKRSRLGKTLTAGATEEARSWKPQDVIRLHWEAPGLAEVNGLYEVTHKEFDDKLAGYRLTFQEYSDMVFDFNPATDEQDFTIDKETAEAA